MKKGYIIKCINPNVGVFRDAEGIGFVGYGYTIYPTHAAAEEKIPQALIWCPEAVTIQSIYYDENQRV